MGSLSSVAFTPHIGSIFTLRIGDASAEVVLREVDGGSEIQDQSDLTEGDSAGERVPFTLVFSGSREVTLQAAVHRVEHPVLGELMFYIKPFSQDSEATHYEAIFN